MTSQKVVVHHESFQLPSVKAFSIDRNDRNPDIHSAQQTQNESLEVFLPLVVFNKRVSKKHNYILELL